MKRWVILKLVLVFLACTLAIIFCEILLRLLTPLPENLAKLKASSIYLQENVPNAQYPFGGAEFKVEIKNNSWGFRDNEFKIQKDINTIRIAVIGDSQEEALQVPLSETWEKVMAASLSEKLNKKVESYSFGVSGYGTDQEWLTLKNKVWQFSPDIVILGFSPNDVGDVYKNRLVRLVDGKLELISPEERSGGNWLGRVLRQSYLYQLIGEVASKSNLGGRAFNKIRVSLLGFPKDDRISLSDAQLINGPFEVMASQKNPPPEVLSSWEIVKALILDMQKQADEHNAKFLVALNVPRAQVDPSDWEKIRNQYHLDPGSSSAYEINDKMDEIVREISVNFYDMRLDAIDWKANYGDLHFQHDGHFNTNGNKFMGQKVADYILAGKLIE